MTTTLYPGIPFSPQATITNNIGAADSIIEVSDVSAFPPAPNLATIGTDEEGETILYTAKTETALSGCQRGIEGTAKAWMAGELIGRNFTAKDHADLISVATTAGTVAAAKQPKLTGQPGQVVGFAADGTAVAVPGWSNPNLLLNWDFRNPVNQNGRTEYTSAGYAIDRWKLSNGKLTLSTTGAIELLVNTDSSYNRNAFVQLLDNPTNFVGKTLTFSILANDINGTVTATAYENGAGSSYDGNRISSYGLSTVTFTIPATAAPTEFRVHVLLSPGGACRPIAAKLELGTQQTLAHQDADGTWVLNDPPPNKALELAKCQRYQLVLPGTSAKYPLLGIGNCTVSDHCAIMLPTPVSMRVKPTAVYTDLNGFVLGQDKVSDQSLNVTNISVGDSLSENSVYLNVYADGLTIGKTYIFTGNRRRTSQLVLDANL